MSENNKTIPAQLAEGEALIPHPLVDKYNEAVKELKEKSKLKDGDIKVSKPKALPKNNSDNVVGSSTTTKKGGKKVSGLSTVNNGALGSTKVEKINKPKNVVIKDEVEKVALHSTKNVHWDGVGSLSKGFNIVRKDRAEKWLTRYHVRLATPEEVAKGYSR
jgi:hypothetical protein